MEAGVALHTAARRYCLERYALWAKRYAEIVRRGEDREPGGFHYTPQALATFPRYNVLNAIRIEIERIDPTELRDFESVKVRILRAGETANDDSTRKPISVLDQRAMAEERAAFGGYIRGHSLADLSTIEPLPFRRVLGAEESETIWARLRARWQIREHYWYPLADCAMTGVTAFDAQAFKEAVHPSHLQGILSRRGVGRVWELREYGPEYEQDVTLFDPHYNGAEGYWSAEDLSWIVYTSHENSVTIGGWLLEAVKAIWPAWQDHLWSGAF